MCARSRAAASPATTQEGSSEAGNILIIILLAIVLIGALSVVIQGSGQQNATIDKEMLAIKISEVHRYVGDLEKAVVFILQNGKSERDLRFAHPNAPPDYGDLSANPDQTNQVFAREGGGANYITPSESISTSKSWEFYGKTALPEVGSDAPELMAVLPNVTQEFCAAMNKTIGYTAGTQPLDTAECLYTGSSGRFNNATQFAASPNTVSDVSFTRKPATQGCVRCDDNTFHFFYVLMAR